MKDKDWCYTCKEPLASERCNTCKYGYGSKNNYKPMTNADLTRSMTDEELAAWYCHDRDCRGCEFGASDGCHILDWLKAPVEEVQDG